MTDYISKAESFSKDLKRAKKYSAGSGYIDGAIKYVKNGKYIIMYGDEILSYGRLTD